MRDGTPHETTLELYKESMKFSSGHFTIISATEREQLHGHNYTVYCALTGTVDERGMFADYRRYKALLQRMCDDFNGVFLLAGESPFLDIVYVGDRVEATFDGQVIPFLASDVKVLPVRNVILEELARLFCEALRDDETLPARERITRIVVKVSSGPGQSGSHTWQAKR